MKYQIDHMIFQVKGPEAECFLLKINLDHIHMAEGRIKSLVQITLSFLDKRP
jgi:hypothetical protein